MHFDGQQIFFSKEARRDLGTPGAGRACNVSLKSQITPRHRGQAEIHPPFPQTKSIWICASSAREPSQAICRPPSLTSRLRQEKPRSCPSEAALSLQPAGSFRPGSPHPSQPFAPSARSSPGCPGNRSAAGPAAPLRQPQPGARRLLSRDCPQIQRATRGLPAAASASAQAARASFARYLPRF